MNRKNEILLFLILLATVFLILFHEIVYGILDQNKVLYIYSSAPQTIGAIYGLTITGYIFFIGNQNSRIAKDPTLHEIIQENNSQQFQELKEIASLVFLSIAFCFITLYIHKPEKPVFTEYRLIISSISTYFSLGAILSNFLFILEVIDPKSIEKTSQSIINSIESQNTKKSTNEQKINASSMSDFLRGYINLEDSARYTLEKSGLVSQNNKNFSSWIDIKQLASLGIIKPKTANQFNILRRYRNALVHSEPTENIPDDMNILLKETVENLRHDSEEWFRQKSLFD